MILELKVVGTPFMQSSACQRLSPVASWQRAAAAPKTGGSAARTVNGLKSGGLIEAEDIFYGGSGRGKGKETRYRPQANFPKKFIRLRNPWDVLRLALEIGFRTSGEHACAKTGRETRGNRALAEWTCNRCCEADSAVLSLTDGRDQRTWLQPRVLRPAAHGPQALSLRN